jgi:hypothetical protein
MGTAWWGRLDGDVLVGTAWWWGRLDGGDGLVVGTVKTFYLILSNLRFRTISRVGFGRRTIAKTRPDPSDKNFCPTLGLDRVGLFDMFETQSCGQSNQNVIVLVENSQFHARIKHIDIQTHFIKMKIIEEFIDLFYVLIDQMIIDDLIKSLIKDKFVQFRVALKIE